jgi:hypothetical protein
MRQIIPSITDSCCNARPQPSIINHSGTLRIFQYMCTILHFTERLHAEGNARSDFFTSGGGCARTVHTLVHHVTWRDEIAYNLLYTTCERDLLHYVRIVCSELGIYFYDLMYETETSRSSKHHHDQHARPVTIGHEGEFATKMHTPPLIGRK